MLSLYDVVVPAYRQGLTGLGQVLAKAEAHFTEQGRDTAPLMGDRLAEDMFPLSVQVAQSVAHALAALRLASGQDAPMPKPPASLAEARQMISDALAELAAFKAEALEGSDTRQITWAPAPTFSMSFDGSRAYLLGFALPNFYFHVTTAYAIVRKNHVPIGKRDFFGR